MNNFTIYFIILQLILLYPSFFLYRKIVKLFVNKYEILITYLLTFFLPIVYTILFYAINIIVINSIIRSKKFDSFEWTNNGNSRYKMVNDIISNDSLKDKSRNEIIEIFGSDYETGPCKNCIGYSTNDKSGFGFSIDHEVIVFYFDESNKVMEVRRDEW